MIRISGPAGDRRRVTRPSARARPVRRTAARVPPHRGPPVRAVVLQARVDVPGKPRTARTWPANAEYGYCASHSRYFWGLRLHLIATLHGLPVGFALTGAKADEREVLLSVLTTDCPATRGRYQSGHRQIMIADKNYYGHMFETTLREAGTDLLRPARKGERPRPGDRFFRPLRQTIESIFDTAKGQLDLEAHGGRTITGVAVRVCQRLLARPQRSGTTTTRPTRQTIPHRLRPLTSESSLLLGGRPASDGERSGALPWQMNQSPRSRTGWSPPAVHQLLHVVGRIWWGRAVRGDRAVLSR